jgi:hypothetical protein
MHVQIDPPHVLEDKIGFNWWCRTRAGATARTFTPIFGKTAAGTPLMQAAPTAGIDLPMKALVWQDADGVAWLSYNDPRWIAARHGIGASPAVEALATALAAFAKHATQA